MKTSSMAPERSTFRILMGAAAASALLLLPAAAAAQACTGMSTQPGQYALGAGVVSYDGATEYRVTTQTNLPGPLGMGVYLGTNDADGLDDNSFVVGGTLSFDLPVTALALCPVSGVRYERFDDEFEGVESSFSSLLVPVGMSAGTRVQAGNSLALIPFAQGGLMYARLSGDASFNGVGVSSSDSETGFFIGAGAGLDLGRLMLRGAVERIDVDSAETSLQFSAGLVF